MLGSFVCQQGERISEMGKLSEMEIMYVLFLLLFGACVRCACVTLRVRNNNKTIYEANGIAANVCQINERTKSERILNLCAAENEKHKI